ncbi:MAG: hypothetical protein R3C11_24585 [Planctomycetaceae bacterium]
MPKSHRLGRGRSRKFSRKHTANIRDGLDEIRRLVEHLVARRDAWKDSFATVLRKAMTEKLGDDAEGVGEGAQP